MTMTRTLTVSITGGASLALLLHAGMVRAFDAAALKAANARVAASAETGHTQRPNHSDQVPDGLTASDWARIRTHLETARYAIKSITEHSAPGQYEALGYREQLRADFTRDSVSLVPNTQPGQPAAYARLVFKGYGYGQNLQLASEPTLVASGNRIEYRRGPLTEWYVNDRRGLEQGFTLEQRPGGSRKAGPLRLQMGVSGTLSGELSQDCQTVLLHDGSGVVQMRYGGLSAWDARRRELPARLQTAGGVLELVVEDRDAVYPLTIDPVIIVNQTKELTASDAVAGHQFGFSVSLSGDTLVVGDIAGNDPFPGAAYVFERNQGGADNWGQVKELNASDALLAHFFGVSVSLSGDTLVVGTQGGVSVAGAAYVFERNQGGADNWGQVKELTASDGTAGNIFGFPVSLSGDTLVVGDWGKNSAAGAAYVFERNQGGADNWGQVKELTASDGAAGDFFGFPVSLSGDTLVVGSTGNNSGAGAAYVFERNQGGADNWGQVKELTASDGAAGDGFGNAVSLSEDTLVVGSPGNNSGAGAAYVFERNQGGSGNWGQVKELTASDAAPRDGFGNSVSLSGDTLVIGSPGKAAYVFDIPSITVTQTAITVTQTAERTASDAASFDEFGSSVSLSGDTLVVGAFRKNSGAGAAYVFERNQGGADNWGQVKEITASDAAAGNFFGSSVSLSEDTLVVGAPVGAVYVFERNQGGADNWGQVKELTASFCISVSLSGDTLVVGDSRKNSFAGAAYVFERNQGGADNWGQVKELTASDAAASDNFGFSVSLSGDTLLVGAPVKNSTFGAAYVFERNQGGADNWGQVKEFTASDAADAALFGFSLSLSRDTLVVGALGKNSNAGAAYVFERNQGGADNWGQVWELTASDAAAGDGFGESLSLSGDTLVVGAYLKNSFAGAAYVFERNKRGPDKWGQVNELTASDAVSFDEFGSSASLSGDTLVVGAPLKNSLRGAAYVFDISGHDHSHH